MSSNPSCYLPAPDWVKSSARCVHRTIATWPLAARAYLNAVRLMARGLSTHRRAQLLNSLRQVTWPASALRPQLVTLGRQTQVWLEPHNGEFDFAVVLGGRLSYEQEVFHCLDERMAGYGSVVEIGANVGVFTAHFAKRLAAQGRGRVFAFEPSSKAIMRLHRKLQLNSAENALCFSCAVSDHTQFGAFFEPQDHLTNGSLLADFAAKFSANVQSTPCLLLDGGQLVELLCEEPRRVLLKIDVEGHEAPLLRALAPVITRYQPDILLEVLPEYASAINEAVRVVAPGYRFLAPTEKGLQPVAEVQSLVGRDCLLVPTIGRS